MAVIGRATRPCGSTRKRRMDIPIKNVWIYPQKPCGITRKTRVDLHKKCGTLGFIKTSDAECFSDLFTDIEICALGVAEKEGFYFLDIGFSLC